MKKIILGFSGGIDSAVSANFLKEQGFEVVPVHFLLWAQDQEQVSQNQIKAEKIATRLGFKLQIIDLKKQFKERVINQMLADYQQGLTPNPCVYCNQNFKTHFLLKALEDFSADLIATGHYAISKDGKIFRAADQNKDQSYFLQRLNSAAVKKLVLPLGQITKNRVKRVAKKLQISEIIGNSESQDLCFLNSSSLINFLHERLPELFKRGEIIDLKTKKKLGNHQGILNFTIGQRARIGGLRKPLYVSKINTKTNTVYVSEKTDLKQKQLLICNPSWLSGTMPNLTNKKFQVQIRHQGKEADCQIYQTKTNTLLITVNQELKAVTPGQHAALYQESQLLGGGIINN